MGRAGPGEVLSQVFALEMREERTEVRRAKSCSAEARAAVRVLNGGRGDGFYDGPETGNIGEAESREDCPAPHTPAAQSIS